jgi:hypothetical protein
MSAGERSNGERQRGSGKAKFLQWEIASPRVEEPHVLSTLGEVTVKFEVELAQGITNGEHGVALFNAERQLMWAQAAQNVTLGAGRHALKVTFPTLPLRPGIYQWQVSLWEGSERLDLWDAIPDMNISTEINQHYRDEWNGILNLPCKFSVQE